MKVIPPPPTAATAGTVGVSSNNILEDEPRAIREFVRNGDRAAGVLVDEIHNDAGGLGRVK